MFELLSQAWDIADSCFVYMGKVLLMHNDPKYTEDVLKILSQIPKQVKIPLETRKSSSYDGWRGQIVDEHTK